MIYELRYLHRIWKYTLTDEEQNVDLFLPDAARHKMKLMGFDEDQIEYAMRYCTNFHLVYLDSSELRLAVPSE